MDDKFFDLFDFSAELAAKEEAEVAAGKEAAVVAETVSAAPVADDAAATEAMEKLNKHELSQAAFSFLNSLHPAAIAENVQLRQAQLTVNAAAFWKRSGASGKQFITRSAAVLIYDDVNCCFADCTDRAGRMANIENLQELKAQKELQIQLNEPHLAAKNDLFDDYPSWDYDKSCDTGYHQIKEELAKQLQELTRGSKMERLSYSSAVDLCFLAIPQCSDMNTSVIPPHWGIVELNRNTPARFTLIRNAQKMERIDPDSRNALALNVAVSAAKAARFAAGVDANGALRRPPRRRRKLK